MKSNPCYYNEIDTNAAHWLLELSRAREIPVGYIDARSVKDVRSSDISKFGECHFFAGIGGWPFALQLARWPSDRNVWTGSCPCQPFSCAGKGLGTSDPRHLWPDFLRLIAECHPATIFGEQVASKAGREWLAGIRADLEVLGYAVGAADLCAACTGAPHIRQRLYWVANAGHAFGRSGCESRQKDQDSSLIGNGGEAFRLDNNPDINGAKLAGTKEQEPDAGCEAVRLGISDSARRESRQPSTSPTRYGNSVEPAGSWGNFEIVHCLDGKSRRFEPGSFPLAHGVSNRVGLLRGYGNAIVPQVAAEFIKAFLETEK